MATMTCGNCGESITSSMEECPACRQSIPGKSASSKLMECTDCGHAISKTAQACPKCGSIVITEKAKADAKTEAKMYAWAFVVIVVFITWLAWPSGNDYSENPNKRARYEKLRNMPFGELSSSDKSLIINEEEENARAAAQLTIKRSLREPSSFEHIDHSFDVNYDDPSTIFVSLRYRAKNGFGGYTISRTTLLCLRGSAMCSIVEN